MGQIGNRPFTDKNVEMIQRLDHTKKATAVHIHDIFQKSYAIEAKLLNAVNFPPLQRTQGDFLSCQNTFYGFYMDTQLAAVLEIAFRDSAVHIQSLAVLPHYFRMGIANSLISYLFVTYPSPLFTVETGFDNIPATTLYKKLGFVESKQWDTDHGVRKVSFEKRF